MPHMSGTINKIFNNEHNPPKTFEWDGKTISNSYGHTVCLKNVEGYFDLGDDNAETPYVKSAGELRVGDEIEFMFDANKYFSKKHGEDRIARKIKRATVQKLQSAENKGSGTSQSGAGMKSAQGSATSKGAYSNQPNPAAVGQCMNLAVQAMGYNFNDMQDESKVREAIILYKTSKDMFTASWEAAVNEPQPLVDDSTGSIYAEATNQTLDDDIPF